MGLEGTGGTHESGGSSGMSGGGSSYGGGGKDKKEKGWLGKFGEALISGLFGWPGVIAKEAMNEFPTLEKVQNFIDRLAGLDPGSPEAEAAHAATNAREAATAEGRDIGGKGADPGSAAGATGGRDIKAPVPKPIPLLKPVPKPPLIPDYFPGPMGTATIKKKRLLGGDIMQRI